MFFASLPLWGKASLVILVIATLAVPVLHLLGVPKFQAQLRRLTPK
jgi:energy-converting hydrogenase Eha subunit H